MAPQMFLCLHMAGLIADWGMKQLRDIREVGQWASDRALLRTASVSAMQNMVDQRHKSSWRGTIFVVPSCKNRVLFSLTMQHSKLLNHWGFQNSLPQERTDSTALVERGQLIIKLLWKETQNILGFFMSLWLISHKNEAAATGRDELNKDLLVS